MPFFIAVMSDDAYYKLLEEIFDNLQELKTRQLLDEAAARELVEETSRQFDELTRIGEMAGEGMKKAAGEGGF